MLAKACRPWWRRLFMSGAVLGLATLAGPVEAQDYEPRGSQESSVEYLAAHVRVNGNSATMYEQRNYYITRTSGPVGAEEIPGLTHEISRLKTAFRRGASA